MKCEYVKKLILTDYLDGQLGEVQKTQIEHHLTICSNCKEYAHLARTAMVEPFNNLGRHNPPETVWRKIREQIGEEQHESIISFASLIHRIKKFIYVPKLTFVVATVTVLLLVVITVIKLPTGNQNSVKVDSESQIECINYLISIFDQEIINGKDDFGTSIEEYFL